MSNAGDAKVARLAKELLEQPELVKRIFLDSALGAAYGIHPVHLGIIMVVNLEIGMVTPPVGLNLFVIKNIAPDISLGAIIRGVIPFVALMFAAVLIICIAPAIATALPDAVMDIALFNASLHYATDLRAVIRLGDDASPGMLRWQDLLALAAHVVGPDAAVLGDDLRGRVQLEARGLGLHRFAVLTAAATLLLIVAGGLVTSNNAGLAGSLATMLCRSLLAASTRSGEA